MDLCSLEDAFPNIDTKSIYSRKLKDSAAEGGSGLPFVGGIDNKATKEERRAARKKAKRCKGPAEAYLALQDEGKGLALVAAPTDPDRPAVKRMGVVEAMNGGKVQVYAPPVGQQALPVLPGSNCLFSEQGLPAHFKGAAVAIPSATSPPSYFGKGEEDPVEEAEGFANFVGGAGDDESYRLVPDFTKVFDYSGLEKASGGGQGGGLPEPNREDNWKPTTPGKTYTAYFKKEASRSPGDQALDWTAETLQPEDRNRGPLPHLEPQQLRAELSDIQESQKLREKESKEGGPQGVEDEKALNMAPLMKDREVLMTRINGLMERLDALEKKRKTDTQHEILLFVGTGLFLLASFSFVAKV